MGWISNVIVPVRKLWSAAPADAKAKPAVYHLGRRWVEPLEPRQLMTATFGNLSFNVDAPDATSSGQLSSLFSGGAAGSVTYTGDVSGYGQSFRGTITVTAATAGATTFAISAAGLNLALPGNLVTLTNAGASLNLTPAGITGTLTGGLGISAGGVTASIANLTLAWDTSAPSPTVKIGGTGSLAVASGQSLTGAAFTFERDGSAAKATVTGAAVSLGGGQVQATGLAGSLELSSAGVVGSGTGAINASFTSAGASFSGTLGFAVDTTGAAADHNLKVTGQAVTVTVGNTSFAADVSFETVAGATNVVGASLTNVTADISGGGNDYVRLTSPTGAASAAAFLIQNNVFAGVIRGTLAVAAPGGVTAAGTGVLEVNTGTPAVTFADPNGGANLVVPAGPTVRAYARGLDLHLSDTRTVHGDFGFALATGSTNGAAATTVTVTAASAGGTFGNATFSNSSGTLTIGPDPIAGSLTGTASFGSGGVAVTAGAFSVTLDPAGFHLSGTDVTLAVAGQLIAGSFSVDAQPAATTFTIANGSLAFGGPLLTADHLNGSFTVNAAGTTGNLSGTLDTTVGQASFAGSVAVAFGNGSMSLAGTADTLAVGDQTVSGDFAFTDSVTAGNHTVTATGHDVAVDLGGGLVRVTGGDFSLTDSATAFAATVSGTVTAGTGETIGFAGPLSVAVSSQAITAAGTADTLTVAGQSFTAGFHFAEDAGGLTLGVDGVNLTLGNGAIAMTNAAGTLTLPADRSGVTGSLSAGLSTNLPGTSLTGTLAVDFTGSTLAVNGHNVTLTVAGQTLTGDLGVTVNGADLDLSATNLTANLGGGLVTVVPPATGSVSTMKVHNGAIAGTFTGVVHAGTAAGASFGGAITVTVDAAGITAAGSADVLTIAGSPITANFAFAKRPDGTLHLTASGINFSLGTVLSVANASGDLTVTPTGVTGVAAGTVSSSLAGFTGTLGVGFDGHGGITISGTNDRLQYGDQFVAGDFTFTKTAAGLNLAAANASASLGSGLVTVANAAGTLAVDANSGAIAGSIAGTVAAGSASAVGFAGPVAVSVANGTVTAAGVNDTLTIAGTPFNAGFKFYEDARGLELNVTGLSFALGSAIAVSGASGVLTINAAGVTGSTAGTVSSAVAGFSGNLGLAFAPGTFTLSGTNDQIALGDQSIGGDFTFTAAGPNLSLAIANGTASLGGGLVRVTNGTANLSVVNGVATGSVSGNLAAGTAATVSFTGPVSVTVGNGVLSAAGVGDTLTVAGQSVTGDVAFVEDATTHVLTVTLAHVAASVAGVLSVSDVHGQITVDAGGPRGTIAGTLNQSLAGLTADSVGVTFAPGSLAVSATHAALNVGGQSLTGDLRFTRDATGTRLRSDNLSATLGGGLVTVAGGTADLAIASGVVTGSFAGTVSAGTAGVGLTGAVAVTVGNGAITVTGTGDTLTVGPTRLTTDLRLFKDAAGLELHVANLSYSLGTALSVTSAAGDLLVTTAGVTGQANGTVATHFTGVTIGGQLGVGFAPGTLTVRGTGDTLTAAGQTISGDFVFTKDQNGLELTAANFAASLGGGLLTVTNGSGQLSVGDTAVSGSFAGTIHAGTVGGGVSVDGPVAVTVGGGGISAATPAGQTDTLTVAGQTVSAAFAVTKDATGLDLAVSNLTASLGGGAVSVTNGGGDLHVTAAGVTGSAAGTLSSGFAGFGFTGNLAATFAPGSLTLSGTNDALTVGTEKISGNFTFARVGADTRLSAANLTASLGNGLVTVANGSGYLTIANGSVSGGFAGTVASGTAAVGFAGPIRVDVAPGVVTASTPAGQTDTITVAGQTLSAGFTFASDPTGLALTMRDVNLSLGGGAVAVTNAGGTLRVSKTGVNGSVYGALSASVPGVTFNSTNFAVTFGGPALTVTGTGVSLTAYGQSIAGNFTFSQSAGAVNLAVSNLTVSVGGIVNVTGGSGTFALVKGGGMTGTAGGNVSIAGVGDSVRFGGVYQVSVGNNAVKVAGTADTLTAFGQTLAGNFSFAQQAGTVALHVNSLNLSLGNGLVTVTGGAADFTLTSAGVTGSASGTLSMGSAEKGVTFGGAVTVALTPTNVLVTGTGVALTIGGTRLSADVAFAQDRASGALAVAITNLSLATDASDPAVVVSGTLLVLPSGLSGTLTGRGRMGGVDGTISATFGNGTYQVTAGVSKTFSETLSGMTVSGTIAAGGTTGNGGNAGSVSLTDLMVSIAGGLVTVTGGSATLTSTGGKLTGDVTGTVAASAAGVSVSGNVTVHFTPTAVTVVGTDDALTILGQTIRGSFGFVDAGDGSVTVNVSGLGLSLGTAASLSGGAASFTLGRGGLKGTGSANVSVSAPGVSFGGAFGLAVDNTNGQQLLMVSASPMTVTVDHNTLTGSFAFQKTTTRDGTVTQSLVASGVDAFVGDGTTGVRVSNAGGSVLFLPSGVALDVSGTASLVGVTGLTMSGTLDVRVNDTGRPIDETVPAPGGTQRLRFAANEDAVSGTATLAVARADGSAFVSLSGGFSATQQTTTVGSTRTTKVLVGAAGLSAFLGGNGTGLQVDNANLGLVLFGTTTATGHTSSYALDASGTASLVGVTGLTLSGTAGVRSDTAGAVNETIAVPDPRNPGTTVPVSVRFAGNTQAFAGTGLTLAVADGGGAGVSLGGDFTFDKAVSGTTTTVTVTGRNVTAFVGSGTVGLQLNDGQLGVVVTKAATGASTYALDASGTVGLTGLPGLNVGGTLSVTRNTTAAAVASPLDPTVLIPVGGPVVKARGLSFGILDGDGRPVLSVTLDATVQKTAGVVDINTTNAELALTVAGQQLIDLQGSAEFTVGAAGFKLGAAGFRVTNFSILGGAIGATPAAVVSTPAGDIALPAAAVSGTTAPIPTAPTPVGTPRTLGPLSVYGLKPIFKNFSFSNGQLDASVGLSATTAALKFGSGATNPGGTTATFVNLAGSLQLSLGLNLSTFRVTSFGSNGRFALSAGQFILNVPNVVNASATDVNIGYDPNAAASQQIVSIGSALVTVPVGSGGNAIQGAITPYTTAAGVTVPGLVVYGDHFQLGRATIKYIGTIGSGGFAQIVNPSVSITDLSASFTGGGISFNGGVTLAADSALIGPSSFRLTGTGVSATLAQDAAHNWAFQFKAATLGLTVSKLQLTGTNVVFNPGATGSATLVSMTNLAATLSLSKFTLTGSAGSTAGAIVIRGDGSLSLPANFTIGLTIGAGTSGALGWPSWVPVQLQSVVLTWPDFAADQSNFTLTFSAAVNGQIGPIHISGSVQDVTIDIGKLTRGEFPITSIGSAVVHADGSAFGGTIFGTLLMGVIKLDATNHQVTPGSPYDHTVFYTGIDAGFDLPDVAGLRLRFGLSENGPLAAYVQVDGDVMIVPPADLALKSLAGGITFDAKPFPTISRAADLKSAVFSSGSQLTPEQWLIQLRQQVVIQSGGGDGGYLFSAAGSNIGGLDGGAVPADLLNQFLLHGDPLGGGSFGGVVTTQVVAESPGNEWLVSDGGKFYLLDRNATGGVDVSQFRFALDSAGTGALSKAPSLANVTAELTAGTVGERTIAAFGAYGITLTSAATVTTVAPRPGQPVTAWTITAGTFAYHVTQTAAGVLTVQTTGGSMGALNGVIQIEAAATIGFFGVPTSQFSASADIIIETDGKILLNAYVNFGAGGGGGNTVGAGFNFRAFVDLSHAGRGTASTLFYFEQDIDVPGFGVLPQLTIAAGATFGRTDSSGNLIAPDDTTSVPDGFGVRLNGAVTVMPVPAATLTLTGDTLLTFNHDQAKLQFNATLSASIAGLVSADDFVTAAGAFTVQYGGQFALWGAAELVFSSGNIPFMRDAGVEAQAAVFLRINTDADNAHSSTIHLPVPGHPGRFVNETFDFQPSSFGLYLVGTLAIHKGPVAFDLNGVFDVDFKDDHGAFTFDVFAFAEMNLGIDGQTLMSMTALGLLEINNDGLAAMLAIHAGASSAELDFRFNFTLFTNTTGHAVNYTLPADLTALINQMDGSAALGDFGSDATGLDSGMLATLQTQLANIYGTYGSGNGGYAIPAAGGGLTVTVPAGMPSLDQNGSITGEAAPGPYLVVQGAGDLVVLNTFTLHGDFAITATPDGVGVQADATLHIGPLLGISASGTLDLTSAGMVAALTLAVDIEVGGFASLSGAATLQVNTTGTDQTVKQYTYNPATHKVSNTPSDVVISGNTHVLVDVQGELVLAGFFNLHGEFFLSLTHDPTYGEELTMAVHASIDAFFGLSLDVQGSAAIFTGSATSGPGLVLSITVAAGFNLASVVQMNGSVNLQVNTFDHAMTIADPAAPLTSTISVANGVHVLLAADVHILSMLTFHATGSVAYDNVTGVFTLAFDVTENINLFIFNQSFHIGGWVDSTGQFCVSVYGEFHFGIGGVISLDGYGYLTVANMIGSPVLAGSDHMPVTPATPQVSGHRTLSILGGAGLSGEVLGITIASISIDFGLNSNFDIFFNATVHLNFFFFSIDFGFTVTVGNLNGSRPPEVYLAGTPTNAQLTPAQFPGGTLVVNAGPGAVSRNWQSTDLDEAIGLKGTDYNPATGTETVYVTIDGYTQAFRNVTRVQVPAGGNNNIQVDRSLAVPVDITAGGVGKSATVVNNGTGGGNVTGGAGNDLLIAGANAGLLRIRGGGGNDTVVAGSGPEAIDTSTGGGHSQILWNADTGNNVTVTGGGGSDELFVTADSPGTAYVHGEKLNLTAANGVGRVAHTLNGGATVSAYFTNLPAVTISAPAGGNTIAVGDMTPSTLRALTLDFGPVHTLGNAVSVLGSTGSDVYTLDSGTAPLPVLPDPQVGSIFTPHAIVATPADALAGVGTVSVARGGGLAVTMYGAAANNGDGLSLNSNGGTDTFYVPSVAIPTTLRGNAAGAPATVPYTTSYYVGLASAAAAGSLSRISALLTLAGSSGTDVVVMSDESDASDRRFNLTATQLVTDALGAGGRLAYDANIENLNLFAGPGHNTYAVANTGATGLTQIHTTGSDNAFNLNAPLTNPISINGGSSVFGNNTLTVNGVTDGTGNAFRVSANQILGTGATINFANLDGIILHATGGTNTFALDGDLVPTTLLGGGGADTFTVAGTSAPTVIDSGDGNDTFALNGSGAPLTVTGHNGNDTFTVTGNASQMVLNGGTGHDSFTVNSNAGVLTLNGGVGPNASNEFHILGNSGVLTVNTNGSPSTFDVRDIVAPITVNSGDSDATFHVTGPIFAPVNVVGGGTVQNLVVDATTGADHVTVTPTAITGLGAAINYTGLLAVTINGNGGDDTFDVLGDSAPTTINGGNGDAAINVAAIAFPLTVNTGTGQSTVNLNAAGLAAAVTVVGDGRDTLNVTGAAGTGTLSDTTIAGLGTAGVTYAGVAALNLALSAGDDVLTVAGTAARTLTTVDTAGGIDAVAVVATAGPLTIDDAEAVTAASPAGLQGPVTVHGTGATVLSVDDSADLAAVVVVTNHDVTGLHMGTAGIAYDDVAQLNLSLGDAATATVVSTAAATDTRLSGAGTFAVQSVAGPTAITTTAGASTVTVTPAGLAGPLAVVGGGTDTLTIDDTANVAGRSVTVTPTTVAGVTYANVETLNVALGNGDNTVTVAGTAVGTATAVTTGSGNDAVDVQSAGADTSVQTGTGDDTVTVEATTGPLAIDTGTGANVVTVGPSLAAVAGPVTLVAHGDTLNLSDTADATAAVGTLTPTDLTGFNSAGVHFTGVAAVNLSLGNGDDSFTVTDTAVATTVTTGTGNNAVTVEQTSGPTRLSLGTGRNAVAVLGTAAATTVTSTGTDTVTVSGPAATLDTITAPLIVHGNANTTLTLDDSGSPFARTAAVSAAAVNGLSPAAVAYDGVGTLNLTLGSAGTTLTVADTSAMTTVTGTSGTDAVTVADDSAPLAVHAGTGRTTVAVAATHGATTITTAAGGTTVTTLAAAGIAGPVTVAGNGADMLTVDGSADATTRAATLDVTTLSGLTPAPVTYAGVAALTLNLGAGRDAITVADTATPTTINGSGAIAVAAAHASVTVNTDDAGSTVAVQATAAAVTVNAHAGDDVTLGTAGSTAGLTGPVTVAGSRTLTVDDSADPAAAGVVLTQATLAGLTPTPIAYAGVAALAVRLGTGANTVTVNDTSADTTVTANAGDDTFAVNATSTPTHLSTGGGTNTVSIAGTSADLDVTATGTTAVTVGTGHLAAVAGTVAVTGATSLTVDGSADDATTAVVTPASVTGPVTVDYAAVGSLSVRLGDAGNTVVVNGTSAPTDVTTGSGNDAVAVTATTAPLALHTGGGANAVSLGSVAPSVLSALAGPVTVDGGGADFLTLDDTGNATPATGTIAPAQITGFTPAPVAYRGVGNVALSLGTGGNAVTVAGTSAPTTVSTGAGTNAVTVNAPAVAAPLSLQGSGNDAIALNATDAAARGVVVSGDQTTGLSADPIRYAGAARVAVSLGAGANTVTIRPAASPAVAVAGGGATRLVVDRSTSPAVTVSNGSVLAAGSAPVTFADVAAVAVRTGGDATVIPLDLTAPVDVTGSGTLTVDDSADVIARTVTVAPGTFAGVAAAVTSRGFAATVVDLGAGDDTARVNEVPAGTVLTVDGGGGSNTARVTAQRDLAGKLTLNRFGHGSVAVNHDLTGTLAVDGSLDAITVGHDVTGSVNVTGNIGTLTVGGADRGDVTAGSISSLRVGADQHTITVSPSVTGVTLAPVVTGGDHGKVVVALTNAGTFSAHSVVSVVVYALPDGAVSTAAVPVGSVRRYTRIGAGRSFSLAVPITIPASLASGTYQLAVQALPALSGAGTVTSGNLTVAPGTFAVQPPVVSATVVGSTAVTAGRKTVEVRNVGPVAARGSAVVTVYASGDGTAADAVVVGRQTVSLYLSPGKAKRATVSVVVPIGWTGGQLFATVDPVVVTVGAKRAA